MSNNKKTYIGYDLGDGETIVNIATLQEDSVRKSIGTLIKDVSMPDTGNAGQAIPTIFGYNQNNEVVFASTILIDPEEVKDIHVNFKRRPSDLLSNNISENCKAEIMHALANGWKSAEKYSEFCTSKMMEFKRSVTSFTNAVFEYPQLKKVLRDEASDSEEIVFCVGHPTRWNDFDVAVYDAILRTSILGKGAYEGKKSSMVLAAESRAAFLYVKDKAEASVLPRGTSALLIDIGSSTVDITAMASDSRNNQHNSGNNYLGARFFDFAILEKYISELKRDEEDYRVYESSLKLNPQFQEALVSACRVAKETTFSVAAHKSIIQLIDFPPKRITLSDLEQIADKTPVSDILRTYFDVPENELAAMGKKSWNELFREFLVNVKAELKAKNIKIGRIILTGSASKMSFVPGIISDVFKEVSQANLLNDVDPAKTISKGLALVGPSNEKSKGFQKDIEKLIENEVPATIEKDVVKLADPLSGVIENEVYSIAYRRIHEWKSGKFKTLDDMTRQIKIDCSENNLNASLKNNKEYNRVINYWTVDVIGKDIAVKLKDICDKYGVQNLTVDNLNVMKVSTVTIDGVTFDPTKDIADAVSTILSIVAGIITAIVLPYVLGFIVGIIYLFSEGLAMWLLGVLLAIPGYGWAILLGVAGIAVVTAASKGGKEAKASLAKKIQKINLPQWVRNRMTDEKIKAELDKANIKAKVKESLLKPEAKKKITSSISDTLSTQIKKRADDIKYVIESK